MAIRNEKAFTALCMLLFACGAFAQQEAGYSRIFSELPFRGIGPAASGGRVSVLAGDPSDERVFYVGGQSGGLWKTTDGGISMQPVFQTGEVSSMGAAAVSPVNPDIVWIGTGEVNLHGISTGYGDGVYRSDNAGSTWLHVGLADTLHIGRILADPSSADTAYVAAVGGFYADSEERGVFKTTDGGRNWNKVLFVNNHTGAVDIVMLTHAHNVLLAAAWDTAWEASRHSGKSDSSIYRSMDGGDHWQAITSGLPTSAMGRISLAVTPAAPDAVLAEIEGADGGVFRSGDRGETWTRVNSEPKASAYFGGIAVDPTNANRIWIVANDEFLHYSEDGGKTFCLSEDGKGESYCTHWLERAHFDSHAIYINPKDPDFMLAATDGGAYLTRTRGKSWELLNTLPFAQYYDIGYDMQQPYNIYGGMQDTGSWGGPVRTRHMYGIANDDWKAILGGDGYTARADPEDPSAVYAEYQGGRVFRLNLSTHEVRDILPIAPPGAAPYRFSGDVPLIVSRFDHNTLYVGGDRLFVSHDRGETWSAPAPLAGGYSSTSSTDRGGVQAGVLSAVAEAIGDRAVLWTGSNRGLIHVSRDQGKTWKDVTAALPNTVKGEHVSRIAASRLGPGSVYISLDGQDSGDLNPHIVFTGDYGQHWKEVQSDLPPKHLVRAIAEDPVNANLLFAGTEWGLYASPDRGAHWYSMQKDLPAARVFDLFIHPREHDLVLGTQGLGIFVLDDIGPLEQMTSKVPKKVVLYRSRTAILFRMFNNENNLGLGNQILLGLNPPYGALLSYYLPSATADPPTLTILDQDGHLVRKLTGPSTAGLNRINWDLHEATPFPVIPGLSDHPPGQPGGLRTRALELSQGPLVLPGTYTIQLDADGVRETSTVRVEEDPNLHFSRKELEARHAAWDRVATDWADGNATLIRIQKARSRIKDWLGANPGASATVRNQAASIDQRLGEDQSLLFRQFTGGRSFPGFVDPGTSWNGGVVNRLGQMFLTLGNYSGSPTASQMQIIGELDRNLQTISAEEKHLETQLQQELQ